MRRAWSVDNLKTWKHALYKGLNTLKYHRSCVFYLKSPKFNTPVTSERMSTAMSMRYEQLSNYIG